MERNMDNDIYQIQMVRRMIEAELYYDAYRMLKETNHPQVPHLEAKLAAIIVEKERLDLVSIILNVLVVFEFVVVLSLLTSTAFGFV
jgi:hypothetical protein